MLLGVQQFLGFNPIFAPYIVYLCNFVNFYNFSMLQSPQLQNWCNKVVVRIKLGDINKTLKHIRLLASETNK